jgi:hypothetical protein
VFELVEEAFDAVPLSVQREVGFAWVLRTGAWRDDGVRAGLLDGFNKRVAVVSLVGDDVLRWEAFQQRLGLRIVRCLARRQDKAQGIAKAVDGGVDFCRQTTFRTAKGFRLLSPPFAPALCWWARTMVESIITYSKSGSPDSSRNTRSHTPVFDHRL